VGVRKYHALGPVAVTDEAEQEIPLGGPRQRRLIAMLLIHRNSVVSVDRLAEAVFAGKPTDAASTTLRSYVARLRRVVDVNGGGGRANGVRSNLLTMSPGYLLEVADDAFDVARFEALLAAGRVALDHGDPVSAAGALRAALAAWHGEPYAEFADEDWVRSESHRLQELRLVAYERLVDAELERGRAAEMVSELEGLVAEHPLRDGFRERLMVALYRAGRQADALRAYQDHRTVLAEDLGLDPSPALLELERRILEHDPALHVTEPAGRALRGYRLGERLGAGREGTVYAARLAGVERELAIRVYREDVADRLDFVRRFEADVQRIASLDSDAIVPIHDYWREPGAAYLVMRRMSGGTLLDRLQQGPLARADVAALVTRVGGALEAAAAEGLQHGRLTPSCVLFDDRGVAYLSDFTVGAPVPEPDRDGRDFATLIAACLTGSVARGPDPDVLPAALRELLACGNPPIREVVSGLLPAVTGAAAPPDRVVNPYKGLRAFDEPDAADFFGRDGIVDELLDRLRQDDLRGRLVVVVGASGSGKSSIVRAGVVPRVRAGEIAGSASWYVTTMLPGGAPYKELAEGLRRVAVAETDDLEIALASALAADESGIDRMLRGLVPDPGELLLVIDQFEELFTLTPVDEQRAFLDALMHAVTITDSRLRVVATLRADFYDRPLQFHRFGAALRDATVTVPAMSASGLEAAVIGPAARAGIAVEPAVAVELVAAVVDQPAALPSLQFTLFELAERSSTRALTREGYDALGGIDVAIAARAEQLYRTLDDAARASVRRMFERLVVVSPDGEPTRRRARCSEITSLQTGTATEDIVETWVQARLLTRDRHPDTREPTVEVAHEAVLREWPRLRGWIDEDRAAIVALGQLREAAASWVELDRDAGALYRGARLEHAVDVMDDRVAQLPPVEHEFLDASRAARDEERRNEAQRVERQTRINRRLRLLVAGIAAGLVISLGLGFVAVDQRDRANTQRRVAVARELAAASVANLDTDPERSVLLALEALERTRAENGAARREAEEALHRAVGASRVVLRVPDVGGWVDWSPNGEVFVTEGPEDSGIIDIRDARTGASVRSWRGHEVDINNVAFNDDGTMLATAGDDGALRVWDPATGGELLAFETTPDDLVFGASFSPDGRRVAAGWSDGAVRVLDVDTGNVVAQKVGLGSSAFSTHFSPDGTRLVVGSFEAPVAVVIDTRTGEEVFRLEGHEWAVFDARWSPDGAWIATASGDGTARIWDAQTGAPRFTLKGHTSQVMTADWSPDSRRLVTGSEDGTARVWEITEQGAFAQLTLSTQDTRNGLNGVKFSPDGRQVMAGVFAITATVVWNVTVAGTAEWANLPAVENFEGVVSFTPDGAHLVASSPDRSVTVWDTETWRESGRIGPASGEVSSLAVSADGRWLATGTWDGPVDVWNLATGEHRFRVEVPFADDVAWSRAGDLLAVASDSTIRVVDVSGDEQAVLLGDTDAFFRSVDFDPTGTQVVTTQYWSGRPDFSLLKVQLWDWERGEVVRTIDSPAESAVFAPDGTRVASTNLEGGVAEIFDAESGESLATLSGHTGHVTDVEYAPDGSVIATSGSDATVRLWDAASGAPRLVLRGHQSKANGLTFSPDGSMLASVGADGVVRVWALDLDDLVAIAQQQVTRTLTDAECRQYLHVESCSAS
jgi:WD40 repeat protein/DNA-binding SARP family transcriptional activator